MAISLNKKLLNLAVCSAMMGMLPVAASAQEDGAVEEIVVLGMRSSIENAQDLKRNADTVKDVITASDIGALPDKSVTEALQRIPGVTIERFASSDDPKHYADEGTGVLVRGLDRVRSEINGRDAFSANPWGGLSYEDFPAELLGAVEVVKNQTADLISGGIAGTVNLITRKPFDSNDRVISFSAKANYGDFREEVTPSFSGLFSDSWETSAGKFGFLIAGSQSKYETRGDGVGLGNYHSRGFEDAPASWDNWGGLVNLPGKVEGQWDSRCMDWNGNNAWTWFAECTGPTAKLVTADEAYVAIYDGAGIEGQPDGETWYAPASYHMSTAENDRKRTGFTTSLQWQNTDETLTATLEHINSKASLEWRERVIASGDRGFVLGAGNAIQWTADNANGRPVTVNDKKFLTSGVGSVNDINFPLQFRSRYNYNENTVEDTSFNLNFKPTDRFTASLDYQHVDSEQIVHNQSMVARVRGDLTPTVAPFFMDLRGSTPKFEYLNERISHPTAAGPVLGPVNAEDPDGPQELKYTYPDSSLGSGIQNEVYAKAKMDSFKLDFQYDLDGVWTSIKSGVYYSDKELKIGDTEYNNWVPIGTPWNPEASYIASPNVNPELFERVNFSDYYNGKVLQGTHQSFLFPKMDLVKNFGQSLRDGCGTWNAIGNANDGSGDCSKSYEDLNDRLDGYFAARHLSSTNEKRTEFYVRGDFAFDEVSVPVKGNVGLRYVNYKLQSTGFLALPEPSRRGTINSDGTKSSLYRVMEDKYPELFTLASGGAVQSTVDGTDYNTVLPSLNLNFSVHDDVVVRFGASKGLYYPTMTDTRNSMIVSLDYKEVLLDPDSARDEATNPVIDLENIEISAVSRNAYLKPEEAINLDLTTEWYFAPAGSISVGLFHKKLKNIIRNQPFNLSVDHAGNNYPVSAYGPDNTGSGTLRGVEFSYSQFYDFLPGAWSGLGLQFNYTYIDQDGLEDPNKVAGGTLGFLENGAPISDNRNSFRVFSGLPLQGYSDKNMNVVGMYEYSDFSFRLAYTWRSEYMLTLRESEEFVPAFAKAQGMMDASLYYTINDNWKIGVEGSNLLNAETKTRYQMNQEGVKTDALSFTTDRRYALSLRATF